MSRCIACDETFVNGDKFFRDVSGGHIHAACAGPEREGYVDENDEPLVPDTPIPEPQVWDYGSDGDDL